MLETQPSTLSVELCDHPAFESALRPDAARAEANILRAGINSDRNEGREDMIGRATAFRSFSAHQLLTNAWSDDQTDLTPEHVRYLQCRANSEYVANVRGVHSQSKRSDKWTWLEEYGYEGAALHHLGSDTAGDLLFIPLYSTHWGPDEAVLTQVRANNAREVMRWKTDRTGQPLVDTKGVRVPDTDENKTQKTRSIKFEAPANSKRGSKHMELPADVHPLGQEILDAEPGAVLIWTEGAAKGDALLTAGLAEGLAIVPVSLTGVTMGYHKATESGVPVPTLVEETVGLFDHSHRLEILAFDADWKTNRAVANAMVVFGDALERAGATVGILDTPGVTNDGKGGIDDYLYQEQLAGSPNPLSHLLATRLISLAEAKSETKLYPNDDVGRSDRLADAIIQNASHAFDTTSERWIQYDALRGIWTDEVIEFNVAQLAKMLTERDARDPDRYFAGRSARAINAAVSLASHDPRVQMRSDQCDLDPYLLNTVTGVVDLRTGELLPHSAVFRMRKITRSGYNPSAECPTWDAFVLQCVLGDAEARDFLQRFYGMALIGKIREELLLLVTGGGRNGKSTFMKALQNALGVYARTFPAKAFTGDLKDEMLIELMGIRLAIASETGAGNALDEHALKTVTSTDLVSGRALYKSRVEFEPSATMTLLTNHRPTVRASDEGTWRRIRVMPFEHQVTDADKDPDLAIKLEAESEGILRWLVEGCLKFQAEGLGTCATVAKATEQYRQNQDVIGQFIKECLVPSEAVTPNMHVSRSDLKQSFDMWMAQQGKRGWALATFREALQERGALPRDSQSFEKIVKGYPRWYGIGLKPDGEVATAVQTAF